jgi:predicted small lipoprotein YifL
MRAIVSAVLLCLILQACGSKGALVLPPKVDNEPQQSNTNKQK